MDELNKDTVEEVSKQQILHDLGTKTVETNLDVRSLETSYSCLG